MIENWKQAWKLYSVQAAIALAVVAELDWVKPYLPEHWVPLFAALIIFARVVSQGDPTKAERWLKAAKRAGVELKDKPAP